MPPPCLSERSACHTCGSPSSVGRPRHADMARRFGVFGVGLSKKGRGDVPEPTNPPPAASSHEGAGHSTDLGDLVNFCPTCYLDCLDYPDCPCGRKDGQD